MDGNKKSTSRPKSRQSVAHIARDNVTTDVAALARSHDLQPGKKRVRGKSIGPGGLEALKETNGNAVKHESTMQIKSILKPSVPVALPATIPSFDELRKRNVLKMRSPNQNGTEDLLIDFSTPGPSRNISSNVSMSGTENIVDPFSPLKPKSPRHERGAGKEHANVSKNANNPAIDQGEDARQIERKAVLEQRAARRKSMANRRVSFAPEATLHTWSVMEMADDSTTSSASNSTRRQPSMTAAQSPTSKMDSLARNSDFVTTPPAPPERNEEPLVEASPADQRDSHQKKRRRTSSGTSEDALGEETFSSPGGDATAESSPIRVEDSIDSESDTDGDTAMSLDDSTTDTIRSADSSSTQSSLDERLRRAATHAGTRGIEYDEHGEDLSMELPDGTVTNAFKPWAGQAEETKQLENHSYLKITNEQALDQAQSNETSLDDDDNTEEMTMEVTRAVGGILSTHKSIQKDQRKASSSNRRRSSMTRRRSSGDETSYGDESMDFTTVAGGILHQEDNEEDGAEELDFKSTNDQEMTMEFTNVLGSVQSGSDISNSHPSTTFEETESMDMTIARGGILDPIEEQTEPQIDADDDETAPMDMTRAVGQIMAPSSDREGTPLRLASFASETGSPSLKPRLSGRGRSATATPTSAVPSSPKVAYTQRNDCSTPSKQVTPLPSRSKTPERTPVFGSITRQGVSPRKLFKAEIKARMSPVSRRSSGRSNPLFSCNEETGHQTPRVVLHAPKPHQHLRRRSSGLGIDKEGVGSPRVSEILSRRSSIGDAAVEFKLNHNQKNRLRFEDPQELEDEVDAERAEEQRRESGRFVMEREANEMQDDNATLQLKEMIESMTPKKSKPTKLKARKSLAVGAAKGLLGKRPAELDLEDEENGESTPKRLKAISRDASPVKNIHLPKPPTKEETTGRLTRAEQRSLASISSRDHTPVIGTSPSKSSQAASPQHVARFKEVPRELAEKRPTSFEERLDNVVGAIDFGVTHTDAAQTSSEDEKISLQQFLNMTNIHFIELSTTKRRHTLAQSLLEQPLQDAQQQCMSLETNFVAAVTTLPLLELYQHATRELKSYISSGRKIIRSIETETLFEQPVLFRDYVEARPDVKMVMDNQFRNGKTNARLQSKEGWYTWRGQLVDGLRGGLTGIMDDMHNDEQVLREQEDLIQSTTPNLLIKRDSLQQDTHKIKQKLSDMDSIDRDLLKLRRQQLEAADRELREKRMLLKNLQQQMHDKREALSQAAELKAEMHEQIAEADRVREQYRGWPVKDVISLRSKVEMIRKQTGWSLISAEEEADEIGDFGVALTMMYRDELRLFFYPSVFQSIDSNPRRSGRKLRSVSGPSAPISLAYIPRISTDEETPPDLTTEQRFFLQLIRGQLHGLAVMPKGSVNASVVLDTVATGWNLAHKISKEIRCLRIAGITRTSICNDEQLATKVMLMRPDKSRVDIDFACSVAILNDGAISSSTSVTATPMYGSIMSIMESSKIKRVQIALTKEVESKSIGDGAWFGAMRAFTEWLQAQSVPKAEQQQRPNTETQVTIQKPSMGPSTTPSAKRSPLAPKSISRIQKKTLPVPMQRLEKVQMNKDKTSEKENIAPVDVFSGVKPAIPPEIQEAMMHTPVKRRMGALRRSPV